jgi:2-hydroxychromene-2-carboxylate isomerase
VEQPVFYYDLGCPDCYLVAEAIMSTLAAVPEWEPVLAVDFDGSPAAHPGALAAEVKEAGLQPLRWPEPWPPDTRTAMLAATYAKQIGRAVAFSLAAFRQQFAGGRDLGDTDTVLLAGAACEMHPTALLKGIEMRSVVQALERAGDRARAAGVTRLPAIEFGERVFEGPAALVQATTVLGGAR